MTSHAYSHPADLPRILAFVRAVRPPERLPDYPNPTDLQELLAEPENQQHTRLWLDSQAELAAYAMLDDHDQLLFDCIPAQLDTVGAEIIKWTAAYARGESGEGIYSTCLEENQTRQAFLQAHGFKLQPDTTLHYARPLDQPIPEPILPPGFSIRPLRGEIEVAAVAELHRIAFGTQYMDIANRLAIMRTSEYDPQMDLVAVAPDGRLAAYTIGAIHAEENARTGQKIGFTDPVASHPDYQRLGLARALLFSAMKLLKERGIETVKLSTSHENSAMQKTAKAAGFVVESKTLWFRKPIK